ncbi:10870_t:CDS:2, partial [Funneliformis mosseae]
VYIINENVYDTFEEAVRQLELLDKEKKAYKLLKDHLSDLDKDYLNEQQLFKDTEDLSEEDFTIIITKKLINIEKYLLPYKKCLTNYSISPSNYFLLENNREFTRSDLIIKELNYNSDKLNTLLNNENDLNIDQKNIYNIIIQAFNNEIDET